MTTDPGESDLVQRGRSALSHKEATDVTAPVFSDDFCAALDSITSYIYIVDPETYEVLHCNRQIEDHGPGSRGSRCYAVYMGADAPCADCPVAALRKNGGSSAVEMLRPDGMWLLAQASPIRRQGRDMMMMTCIDITKQKRAEMELREQEAENAIVIRQSGKFVLRYDIKNQIAHNCAEAAELFGIPEVLENYPEYVIESGVVAPDSVPAFRAFFAGMRSGEPTGSFDMQLRLAVGGYRYYHADYTLVPDEAGAPAHVIVSFYDNTEQKKNALAYEKLQNDLSVLVAESASFLEGNLSTDTVERILGLKEPDALEPGGETRLSQLLEEDCVRNVAPQDRDAFRAFYDRSRLFSLCAMDVYQDGFEFRSSVTGEERWYRSGIRLARAPYSDDVKLFILLTDVTETRREHERLESLAYRDSMTRLLNRDATEARIREALAARGPKDVSALFMIDLDNFKQVNDTRGHRAGDDALRSIAAAITDVFRAEDVVGRIGGDEFIAFVAHGASEKLAGKKAQALIESLQFSIDDLVVTASVGVSLCTGGEKSFDQLYSEADRALYHAKNTGKSRYSISSGGEATLPAAQSADSSVAVQFKTLLENIDGGVVLASVGEDVRITYVSPSYYRSMGHAVSDRSCEDLLALILPEDLPCVTDALRRAAAGAVVDCAYRIQSTGPIWRQLRAARLSEGASDGGIPVIGVITDITALKRTESDLRVAEERYRLAMMQTGGLIWEVDVRTRTLYQSAEVSAAFGAVGTVFPDAPESVIRLGVIHPDSADEYRQIFRDIYAGRESGAYTLLVGTPEHGYTWTRTSYLIMRDADGAPARSVGVSEKLTNVEPEMRAFNEELRFMDLTASSLFGAAHVNLSQNRIEKCTLPDGADSFVTYDDLYARRDLCVSPEETAAVSAIMERGNLIAAFQNGHAWQFVEYRRKNAGGGWTWINASVNLLRHPVSGDIFAFLYFRDIDARRRWELSLPGAIERDSATMLYTRETLGALAAAAVPKLGAEDRLVITVFAIAGFERMRAEQGLQAVQKLLFTLGRLSRILVEGNAVVGVLDETHIGVVRYGDVSAEQHRDTVERYRERVQMLLKQTVSNLSVTLLCGFSMGDAAHTGFDELVHQASVACESSQQRPGRPVTLYVSPNAALETAVPAPPLAESEKRRILVADDDPVTCVLLQKILGASCTVDTAANGQEALDRVREYPYSLVISDINMPVRSGWEVLETIRADKTLSEIPVVIITADADVENEIKALTLGAADIIVKPFVAKTLRSRVANIIGRNESARTSEQNRLYELRFQQQAYLLRLAEHDELTGLYNRQAFYRRVRERLNETPGTRYMIVRWDMDNFKMLNDALGVETGDRVLIDIARFLREHCGKESIYARLEADHFVDFLPVGFRTPEDIFREVTGWFSKYPLDFKLTGRMGVYFIDDPGVDVSIMCDRALLALRSTKGNYAGRVAYYDETLRQQVLEEQALSAEMVPALRERQFRIYFQPQVNYDTGEMIGAEALVRWEHPTRGLLSPGVFIPLFERNGFISALDEYVWEESCRCMRRWREQQNKLLPVSVSVNISRIDIYNPHLIDKLLALVKKYDLEPSFLRLEITESAYMQNPDQLAATVHDLRAKGFTVEMDDFGAGYSALATLKDVPVDILKLDMRFLSSSKDDARGGNLISSVIRMAHWLKLPIIAEGVETQTQADYLKSLNCFYMQGYYFGKPVPPEEFETLLRDARIGATDRYKGVNIEGMAAFWDPSAQSALLFNSFLGGAAIAEYSGGNVEIVRANDRFFRTLGITRAIYVKHVAHILSAIGRDSAEGVLALIESAVQTGQERDGTVTFALSSKGTRCIRLGVRLLARNNDSCLLFASVSDQTELYHAQQREREQAERLHSALRVARADAARDRLVIENFGALIFDYDYETDTLSYQVQQPRKGLVTRRISRYLECLPGCTVVHPDSLDAYRNVFLSAAASPIEGTLEYVADNLGTGFRWCRGYYASIAGEDGRVYRLVGVVRDIQGEKDREERKRVQ